MNDFFINEIKNIKEPNKRAIEFGPGFPFNLIQLFHLYNFRKCAGIEKQSLSGVNLNYNEIVKEINLPKKQVENLILDDNPEIQFYNAYRIYTVLKLQAKPLDYDDLFRKIKMDCCKRMEEIEVSKYWPKYHVLIASKVWSHLDETHNKSVLKMFSDLLMPNGIIYLKLNSEDYLPLPSHSSIKQVFNEQKCKWIKNKFTILDEKLSGEEGRKEYELVLKSKDNR